MITTDARVDAFGLTDPGKERKHNEDQFLIADLSKSLLIERTSLSQPDHERLLGKSQGRLFLVADGMGGHGGGELASSIAVDAMINYVLNMMPWFFRLDDSHEDDLPEELKAALVRCDSTVLREAERKDAEHPRMGTTLTMAYVIWPRLYVVHAGDSRAYLFRSSRMEQITKDHTLAQQLADTEVIHPDKVDESRFSNVLWNALGGGSEELSPEVYSAELTPGDALLLCTDGLTNHLSDEDLAKHLAGVEQSAEVTATELIGAANAAGGSDNITVVVARFQ